MLLLAASLVLPIFTQDHVLDLYKDDKYLKNRVPGIVTITAGATNTIPAVRLTAGDINSDGLISIADYNILAGCLSFIQPAQNCDTTRSFNSDITDDGSVNEDDYNLFLRESSILLGD